MISVSVTLLAFGMSMDAFAAAIGKGTALNRPGWREAMRIGLIFGVIEFITPLLGWLLGQTAAQYVSHWDHWIAFVLLCFLGGRMILSGARPASPEPVVLKRHPFWILVATGIATSIDAFAIGVGLAFLDVPIIPAALAIGMATFLMTTIGVLLGRVLGKLAGRQAEILGGVLLIVIGAVILKDHLLPAA